MNRIKTAIHLHTDYSYDTNQSPEQLVDAAVREGIDCVAITDHDEIDGALAACRLGRVRVIVGEEVSTRDGHLIGLFLNERIPPGRSAEETIERIRAQGGVVLAPHPFSTLCDDSLRDRTEQLVNRIDAIEVFNAQNPVPWHDRKAAAFARDHGLTPYAGCDTHIRGRLAPAYQLMPPFDGPGAFLDSLRQAELVCRRFGIRYHSMMGLRHVWDRLFPGRLPGFGANLPDRSDEHDAVAASSSATAR